MRLISIEMNPRGQNGWSSSKLTFGNQITSLYAPNGSGKTPIIQSIVFCLGYLVTYRKDVIEKCSSVKLNLQIKTKN